VSYLLELLGRGLDADLGEVLARYYWSPSPKPLAELERAAREHADWPDAQCQAGLAHLRAMHLEEAIDHLAEACRLKPDYLAARLALAAAYEAAGQVAQAARELKTALLHTGKDARVLFCLGFCCERMRQPAAAAEHYRDAIDADGRFDAARHRLAAVAVLQGHDAEAITQYEHLHHACPHEPWYLSALADLYFRTGQYDRAAACFERAIADGPDTWALPNEEVAALVAAGRSAEAMQRLRDLIEVQPTFPDLHVQLGDLHAGSGDIDAALGCFRTALELQPDYLDAAIRIGVQLLAGGRWEDAAEAFCQAGQINDRHLRNFVGLGVAQLAAGRAPEGIRTFELASKFAPNSGALLSEMARLQLKAAVADELLDSFTEDGEPTDLQVELDNDHLLDAQLNRHEQAVVERPNRADVRFRYGVLLRSQGRLAEALEQFEEAVAINPVYVEAIIKLGITLQDMGRTDEAVATFERALNIRSDYVDVHYRLGVLHTDRRAFDQAVRHMEAAARHGDGGQTRAALALALQNMGLMDEAAATWRSLASLGRAHAGAGQGGEAA